MGTGERGTGKRGPGERGRQRRGDWTPFQFSMHCLFVYL